MLLLEDSLTLLLFSFVVILLGGILIRYLLPAFSGMKRSRRRRRRHHVDDDRLPEPTATPGPGLQAIVAGMQAAERRVAEQGRRSGSERPRQPDLGAEGADPVIEASAAVVTAWRGGSLTEAHIARLEQALRTRSN
ncbi:MAG: hypothetical protein KA419_13490 [Acidobacteria bacterium]|nr:hypothetical protein [Acidobacteriota bacterium]